MSFFQKYKLQAKNFEGMMVKSVIEDTYSPETNPYGISWSAVDNGGGTQTVTVSWTSMPAGCTGTRIDALDGNGVLQGSQAFGTSSPDIWATCPSGNMTFLFFFLIPTPGDDEFFVLNEIEGVTDDLQPAEFPFRLVMNNNGDDKLSPICGLQLQMQFISNTNTNLNKLLRGNYSDRRYRVTTTIEDNVIFRGFLQMADAQEPFLPHPNIIELNAVDGLGSLKNKPLVDASGNNPTGYNKIIKYIAWALRLTGLDQNINVVMNIREEDAGTIASSPDQHIYNTQYLDAKTFETEPGQCEDAYTVLERILKHTCRVGQRHGEWWIKNTDEFDDQPDNVAIFDSNGEFVEMLEPRRYDKEIGFYEDMKWSQESCIVGFISPARLTKLTYRYNLPKEVPCNIDMERGDFIADIPTDSKKYNLECWDLKKQGGGGDAAPTTNGYIRRDFINGYENKRYTVIEYDATGVHFFRSETIPVEAKGKIKFNMTRRLSGDVGGSGFYRDVAMQIRLYADDGTFYMLSGESSGTDVLEWKSTNSSFTTNVRYIYFEGDVSRDMTEAETVYGNTTSPEIPKSGRIQVLIHQSHENTWGKDTYIDKVELEYLAFVNGSYQKYTGQYHQVKQSEQNPESVDDEVYMSDSPARLYKGALHKYNGTDWVLSGRFWNAAVFTGGPPDDTYLHPFGYIQAFNVWNQVRPLNRIFRGSIQGIQSATLDALNRSDLPTIFHTYYMRDSDEHSNAKKFMLLSYSMDLTLCEFSQASFREVHDEANGKVYGDPYEFKYLTR